MAVAASRKTMISACAVGSQSVIVRFPARATIAPSTVITAPTGTSPWSAATRASLSAARMKILSRSLIALPSLRFNRLRIRLDFQRSSAGGPAADAIEQKSRRNHGHGNGQFVQVSYKFAAVSDQRRDGQAEWRQADQDCSPRPAGDAIRPCQVRLANAQRHQRPKLQQDAQPGQQHIQNQVPLESQRVAGRPENHTNEYGYPRHSRAPARSSEYLRQVAILRHHAGQSGERHHQRAKRTNCPQHACDRKGYSQRWSADDASDVHPAAVGPSAEIEPC